MAGFLFKRCGCREMVDGPDGRPRALGRRCPALVREDGRWDARHGSWGFQLSVLVPTGAKRCQLRQFGHPTRTAAAHTLAQVEELLRIAQDADNPVAARLEIAELIRASLRARTALPDAGEIRAKTALGQPLGTALTLGEFLRDWIAGKNDIKPNTRRCYQQHINDYLTPLLGHHRLDRLRATHLQTAFDTITDQAETVARDNARRREVLDASKQAWRNHDTQTARAARASLRELPPFCRPAGPATIQRVRATLRAALTDACKQQLVTVNVAKLVTLSPGRRPKALLWNPPRVTTWRQTGAVPGPVMVWTLPQTRAFLHAAREHRWHALYLLIAHSGLRRGEAVALRWEDIDLTTGAIEIRQQITQHGRHLQIAATKTHAGERTVIAAPTVIKALHAEREHQQQRRDAEPADWHETGLAFTDDFGKPLHPDQVTDQFHTLTRNADLPPIRLHDLRHGAATHALTAGVSLKTVSEMLGHSSYVITADTYTSVADEAKHAAAQAIADLLNPAPDTDEPGSG